MGLLETTYLPADRLQSLANGILLPTTTEGSALFADISGFTPITEKLRQQLGMRRGAETLATFLNQVYDALITPVEQYNGSIISFAGDAITCWFGGVQATVNAAACAFRLIDAIQVASELILLDSEKLHIGLKVSISTGTAQRFVVGDPNIQQIDTLAGATISRLAEGESQAKSGEVIVDEHTLKRLHTLTKVHEWRESTTVRFAVLERPANLPDAPNLAKTIAEPEGKVLRSWLLPAVYRHFNAGLGEYPTELRPATALFIRFSSIDYDRDYEAEKKLDQFVRLTQTIVSKYEGVVLQLTIGDKGSYLYVAFGAPVAHEDDAIRALNAALEIRAGANAFGYLDPIQIGISQGIMRTGAYGSQQRRTYGVLGDDVNLAARLMQKAVAGDILISESMMTSRLSDFVLAPLPPMAIKGKSKPVNIFRLIAQRDKTFENRFYTTPMAGREEELEQIHSAVQYLLKGQNAGVVYVYGEPGIGKSRLVFEAQHRLQSHSDVTWMIGQADAITHSPLNPFIYFLRPYFGQRREQDKLANQQAFDRGFNALLNMSDETNRTELQVYRSYLAGIVGLVIPGSPYAFADEKLRLDNSIPAIEAWVRSESNRQPLVIHLEDAQWLDESSVAVLRNLTYKLRNMPVVLLLTSRYTDDGAPYILTDLAPVPIHSINLKRLNDQDVRDITQTVLGASVTDGLSTFIAERAEGNPFFTEQLVLDLQERGILVETEAGWSLKPNAATEVPSGINSILIARLDRLTEQVRSVVQTAAVLGREFDVQILSRMLRENDYGAIQAAESASIWSAIDNLRYLFRHALLRDAAYEMQVQERLKGLHRAAAEAIEFLYPDDPTQQESLLEHWHMAGAIDRELYYLDPVANRLIFIVHEYARAERLVDRAIKQLEAHDERRAIALNWMSALYYQHGDPNQSREVSLQALALAASDDRATRATSLFRLGSVAHLQDNYDEAKGYFEQCMAIRREISDQRGVASLLIRLAGIASLEGNYETANRYNQESLAISHQLNNPIGIAIGLSQAGDFRRAQGAYGEAKDLTERSLAIERELGNRKNIAADLGTLGTIARLQGEYEVSRLYLEEALTIQQDIGARFGAANTLIRLGNLAYVQGDYANARSFFERSLAALRQIGEPIGVAGNLNNLGAVAIVQGDFQGAKVYLEESLEITRKVGDRLGIAEGLSNLGMLAFRQKAYLEAESRFRKSLAIYREIKHTQLFSTIGWLGRTVVQIGALNEARILLQEALSGLGEDNAVQKVALMLLAGEIYAKQGQLEYAVELVGFIQSYPTSETEIQNDATSLLAEIRTSLDARAVDNALKRGSKLELSALTSHLFDEL